MSLLPITYLQLTNCVSVYKQNPSESPELGVEMSTVEFPSLVVKCSPGVFHCTYKSHRGMQLQKLPMPVSIF